MTLVLPTAELRWLSISWLSLGLLTLLADLSAGAIGRPSTSQLLATLGLLGISVAGSVAGRALGSRTPPRQLYVRVFERAGLPPAGIPLERARVTASRAALAAVGVAVMLALLAPVAVAVLLIALATPSDELLGLLAPCGALTLAGWLLACALAANRLRAWALRWERRRNRVLMCPPLGSGRLAAVYFAAPDTRRPR
ncbi:MAG: hypothetical protein NVSMB51_07080 [Solirubrobacteraceae bacterium]